jgi:hypothetical protein
MDPSIIRKLSTGSTRRRFTITTNGRSIGTVELATKLDLSAYRQSSPSKKNTKKEEYKMKKHLIIILLVIVGLFVGVNGFTQILHKKS